jgi:hypothetical protein
LKKGVKTIQGCPVISRLAGVHSTKRGIGGIEGEENEMGIERRRVGTGQCFVSFGDGVWFVVMFVLR